MTDPEQLITRIQEGDLKLYELEEEYDADVATMARRKFIASATDTDFSTIEDYSFPANQASANIENMIGATQVPIGVAGPLCIQSGNSVTEYYLPLATTEGALVASVNRGCAIIDQAGGVSATVFKNGMTRAPVFRVKNVIEAKAVVDWIEDNYQKLQQAAESTTNHGELTDISPYIVGDSVFVRFIYDTKDAMGMNMATIATEKAAEIIETETSASLVALSGNLCSDKKPAAINAIEGRGRTVAADITIPRSVIQNRFDTDPEAIVEINTRKNLLGSAKAGSIGFNAQTANIVAAMFLATGQDIAQVVEGSNGIASMETRNGDLYASITIASLEVGTIGGGTTLPTQSEALNLIGIQGGGDPPGQNADILAKTIAGGALAGELSLLGALASNNLASAHEKLGR